MWRLRHVMTNVCSFQELFFSESAMKTYTDCAYVVVVVILVVQIENTFPSWKIANHFLFEHNEMENPIEMRYNPFFAVICSVGFILIIYLK